MWKTEAGSILTVRGVGKIKMSSEILPVVGRDDSSPLDSAGKEPLENVIIKKEKLKEMIQVDIHDHRLRIYIMCDQRKQVEQRVSYTQGLCEMLAKDTRCELYEKAVTEREIRSLQQETAQLQKEQGDLRAERGVNEKGILKGCEKLEKMERQLALDQQLLGAAQEKKGRLDKDLAALLEDNTQHSLRAKDLVRNVERKTAEAEEKSGALAEECARTFTTQLEMSRTVQCVVQTRRWNEVLSEHCGFSARNAGRRGGDVEQMQQALPELAEGVWVRQVEVRVKTVIFGRLVSANRVTSRKTAIEELRAAQLRAQSRGAEPEHARLRGEIDLLKRFMVQITKDIEAKTQELSGLEKVVEERANRLQKARLRTAALEEKLRSVSESAFWAERRAREWEQTLSQEERSLAAQSETESRQRQHYEALAAQVQDMKSRESSLLANICASQAALRGLEEELSKYEQDLTRRQQLSHDQDVQAEALERTLQCLTEEEEDEGAGETEKEKRKALQDEVSELANALQAKKHLTYVLRQQQKHVEAELRGGRRAMEKATAVQRDLLSELEELELQAGASDRALKKLMVKKRGTVVQGRRLGRDAERASDHAQTEAEWLVATETRRLQLEMSVKELELETAFNKELYLAQTIAARQENHKLRTELNSRMGRAEKLRMKYEGMEACRGRVEGEQPSTAKGSDQRADLEGRLEGWARKVCERQGEVEALENSLRACKRRNARTRNAPGANYRSAEDGGKKRLVEERKALEETCSSKRRRIHALRQDIKGESIALDKLVREKALQTRRAEETRSRVQFINNHLRSQEEKLERRREQCCVLTAEVRSAEFSQRKTAEEEDIELSELQDFSEQVDAMLRVTMNHHPALGSELQVQLQQNDVVLLTSASQPASQRGDPPCSSSRGLDSLVANVTPVQSCHFRASGDLTLKLAVTRALLSTVLPPDPGQGTSPYSNDGDSSTPTLRCPPNSPADSK